MLPGLTNVSPRPVRRRPGLVGLTNGLTNGARPRHAPLLRPPRFARRRVPAALLALVSCAIIGAPLASYLLHPGSREPVTVDGEAGPEWAAVADGPLRVMEGVRYRFFALREAPVSGSRGLMDAVRMWFDSDNDASTGLHLDGLGADHQVLLESYGGRVESASLCAWQALSRPWDPSGFAGCGPMPAAAGSVLEWGIERHLVPADASFRLQVLPVDGGNRTLEAVRSRWQEPPVLPPWRDGIRIEGSFRDWDEAGAHTVRSEGDLRSVSRVVGAAATSVLLDLSGSGWLSPEVPFFHRAPPPPRSSDGGEGSSPALRTRAFTGLGWDFRDHLRVVFGDAHVTARGWGGRLYDAEGGRAAAWGGRAELQIDTPWLGNVSVLLSDHEERRTAAYEVGPMLAPNPPELTDISGNIRYWLRNTAHSSETACTGSNDKLADDVQGPSLQQITLTAGQDACWYADATQGQTIPAGDWETLLDISRGRLLSDVSSFNTGTGTVGTTIDVTLSFAPKAYMVWAAGRTETTDTVGGIDLKYVIGVATSATDRRCVTVQSADGTPTAQTDTGQRNDAVFCNITTAGAWDCILDHDSYLASGIRFVVDDQCAADYRVQVLAWGGGAITNAATFQYQMQTSTGNQDITSVGFQGNALIHISTPLSSTAPPTLEVDARMGFGFATSSTSRAVVAVFSDDADTNADTESYSYSGEVAASVINTGGSLFARADFVSWLSNGFRINVLENCCLVYQHGLVLQGGAYVTGDFLTQTDTTTTITESGFGFPPSFTLTVSAARTQSTQDTTTVDHEMLLGAFVAADDEATSSSFDDDARPNMETAACVDHDAFYCRIADNDALDGEMHATSIDAGGFQAIMRDADPDQAIVWYLSGGPSEVEYDVRIEIWDVSTDSVTSTIGTCLDVTTYGDDVQCLVSSVAQQVLGANELVRVRIVHSSASGTVTIDFDDADATGDSRLTLPIPEGAVPLLLAPLVVLAAVAWRRRRGP